MRTKLNLLPVLAIAVFIVTSCKTSDPSMTGKESTTTGWSYNDPAFGGFEVPKITEQPTGPGLVLIEGGMHHKGEQANLQTKEATPIFVNNEIIGYF